MSFTPIGDALQDRVKQQGSLKNQVEASQAVEAAERVFVAMFGLDLAAHAKPLFLKNRTLTVSCVSSVMAQEIRLNQQQIVDQINAALGKSDVDRIRYLV